MSTASSSLKTCIKEPYPWQVHLAEDSEPKNRLIRIPTGFGKTAGTVLAWLHNRVVRKNQKWPRRLVFCLPMRTLVEQTENEIRTWVNELKLTENVSIHVLMGGVESGEWTLNPDACAILIGTQDMLLSRALNRGYASARAKWPMEFGLLNHDCLWVMDEVQLMDTALATSAQLQQFREDDWAKMLRPVYTWWMSATLRSNWLKSVDTSDFISHLEPTSMTIHHSLRQGGFWGIKKPLELAKIKDASAWAKLVLDRHFKAEQSDFGRITIVIANTVKMARELHLEIRKNITSKSKKGAKVESTPELHLVHSRFRPEERKQWRAAFLSRSACRKNADRIIVATQVIEAGVDISANTLITELAPWSSLVQRFGRAGRYLGANDGRSNANIIVLDRGLKDDKAAAPYTKGELDASASALHKLTDAGIAALEAFEDNERAKPGEGLLPALYPYSPKHLLLRRELDELFDTTPDLTGADLDISRFIRSGEERDALVFWRDIPANENPSDNLAAHRDELCPVSFLDARKWLFEGAAKGKRAWVWDYLDGLWRKCAKEDVYPGQTLLVEGSAGGYDAEAGFTGEARSIPPLVHATVEETDIADLAQSSEVMSSSAWKTIATHGREAQAEVVRVSQTLEIPPQVRRVLALAALWHDYGKAHPAFCGCIRGDAAGNPGRQDLAKAPASAWESKQNFYRISETERRPGFRHELASMLGLFSLVAARQPRHPAVLGKLLPLLKALGQTVPDIDTAAEATPAERELLALAEDDLNLLLHLVCAHHGKIRVALQAAPDDQEYASRPDATAESMPVRGVCSGDILPSIDFADSTGAPCKLPPSTLSLDLATMGVSPAFGISWTDRMSGLIRQHGPFTLAFLETLIRTADIRASRLTTPDSQLV